MDEAAAHEHEGRVQRREASRLYHEHERRVLRVLFLSRLSLHARSLYVVKFFRDDGHHSQARPQIWAFVLFVWNLRGLSGPF